MIRLSLLDGQVAAGFDLVRTGAIAHQFARLANALVFLDDGLSREAIGKVLFLDDDTIREWHQLCLENDGVGGLATFNCEGGSGRLTPEQQEELKAWIAEAMPGTTRQVGARISSGFGIEYQPHSGQIALPRRLTMEHRKLPHKLDPEKQTAFIKSDESLMNQLPADEAVIFADAAHPSQMVRPIGIWAPKEVPVAVTQSSGHERLNLDGEIDLETEKTITKNVPTFDAVSALAPLATIETTYPARRWTHIYLDNPRYNHAKLVCAWLLRPECRIKLQFVPAYCPHPRSASRLEPIERLWGLMHGNLTHDKRYKSFREFSTAMTSFPRDEVPKKLAHLR